MNKKQILKDIEDFIDKNADDGDDIRIYFTLERIGSENQMIIKSIMELE